MDKAVDLIQQLQKFQPELDAEVVKKALEFAEVAHTGQKRYSGEDYVGHPVAVATILAEWKMQTPTIVAGLLHDTIEDGAATRVDLEKEFGSVVAELVDGVTKVSKIQLRGSVEKLFVENLRKMIVAMSKDLRVVLIKLADRLHNMRTLKYVPATKQARIARETLEIYAPLADRLGMGKVKGELEDLAFPYVYPEDYKWLVEYAAPHYQQIEELIDESIKKLDQQLTAEGIKADISGRKKHFFSLYKKLLRERYNRDITKITDLVALRVLVDTVSECYTTLGIIHTLWKPVLKGVTDYIAQPKPNGYQSIHTDVFIESKIAEIQIRTHQMHQEAEYGVAAHFNFAELKAGGMSHEELKTGKYTTDEKKLAWVRQLVELLHETDDSQELMKELRMDALSDRIFVFTPKGDVVDLPIKATPIDFAYHIHTGLGDRTKAAKVNGKMVGLDYGLSSGDVCEIVESKEAKLPSQNWAEFVVTSAAKRQILKHRRRGEVGN